MRKFRCAAIAMVLLLLNADLARASWLSEITGVDINIPAGTISFRVPRPDAIPDMLKNLPQDILEALNPQGQQLAFLIREAQAQAKNGAQPIPAAIRSLLQSFFPAYILDKARWNVYDANRWTLDSLVLGTDCSDLHLPFNIDCKMGALTLDQTIVFRGSADAQNNFVTWAHELVHVSQYDSMGIDGFAFVYASPGAYSLEKQAYDWQSTVQTAIQRGAVTQTYWTMAPGARTTLTATDFSRAAARFLSDPAWKQSHSPWGAAQECFSILGPGTDTGISAQEAAPHFTSGQAYEQAQNWPGAVAEYREAVRLNHIDAWSFDRLGVALTHTGQADEGVLQIKKAVCLDKSQNSFRNDLARAFLQKGDPRQATLEYQLAVFRYPYSFLNRRALAAAFRQQGDEYDASVQDWAASQLAPPDGGPAYASLRARLLSNWARNSSQGGDITLVRLDHCTLSWASRSVTNQYIQTFSATVLLNQMQPQNITNNNGYLILKDSQKVAIATMSTVRFPSGTTHPPAKFQSELAGFGGLSSNEQAEAALTELREIVRSCTSP